MIHGMKKEKGKFTLGDGESGIGIDEKDNEDCFFAIDTTVVRKGSYRGGRLFMLMTMLMSL